MKHTFHTRIVGTHRKRNTSSGNPQFDVTFANGQVIRTWPDADINFSIENSDLHNREVTVTLERGYVTDVTLGITD